MAAMEKDLQLPVATIYALADEENSPRVTATSLFRELGVVDSNLGGNQWLDAYKGIGVLIRRCMWLALE